MTHRAGLAVFALAFAACAQNTSVGSQADSGPLPCGAGGSSCADAGPTRPDATPTSPDAGATDPDADRPDAPSDEVDASSDGGLDAAETELFLLSISLDPPVEARATRYAGGRWEPLTTLGRVAGYERGSGVAALPDGRGLALVPVANADNSASTQASIWSGGWSSLSRTGADVREITGAPVATSSGAVVVRQGRGADQPILFDRFDAARSSWRVDEETTLETTRGTPVVSPTASGSMLVVDGDLWTTRTSAGWTAPAPAPSGVPHDCDTKPKLIPRRGVDEIVGIFYSGNTDAGCPVNFGLQASVFRGGAWSSTVTVAAPSTRIMTGMIDGVAVAALPDGRVAVAYTRWLQPQGPPPVAIGFFDGTSWTSFTDVPGLLSARSWKPIAIAPGTGGAVLDLVYIEEPASASARVAPIKHTRLIDEARWLWSDPVTVDDTQTNVVVSIAAPVR